MKIIAKVRIKGDRYRIRDEMQHRRLYAQLQRDFQSCVIGMLSHKLEML